MQIQTKYGPVHVLTACPLLDSTETLQFLTEVHENYDGSEDRLNLRDRARQTLSFNYVNFQKAMGDMFHMLYANLRKLWGIPLVQSKQFFSTVDDDFIQLDTSLCIADFNQSYALIDSELVEIIEIGRYVITGYDEDDQPILKYQDGFKLNKSIEASNTYITPLRICIIDGDVSIAASGFYARQDIAFRVIDEDCPEITGESPPQYQDHDIYFKCLLMEGDSLSMTLQQHQVVIDGDLGGFQDFTNWKAPRYLKPFKSLLKNQNEYFEFKNFLFRRLGKYNAFWLPLYEKHLNVVSASNTWIEVDNEYVIEADRKHIAVKINNIWSAHEITSKTKNGNNTRLNITPNLNAAWSQVQSVCYLGLYRLAADTAEFSFLGAGMSQTNIPIVELST